jgi:hypothetical protein
VIAAHSGVYHNRYHNSGLTVAALLAKNQPAIDDDRIQLQKFLERLLG